MDTRNLSRPQCLLCDFLLFLHSFCGWHNSRLPPSRWCMHSSNWIVHKYFFSSFSISKQSKHGPSSGKVAWWLGTHKWARESEMNYSMILRLFQIVWVYLNVLLHVRSCQPPAWGWRWGTPGNQSKLNYLSADNDRSISFPGSSQNVRGKKLKAWTFLMRAIIESSVTQSICFRAFQWLVQDWNTALPCGIHRTPSTFFEEELMIFIYHAHHFQSLTVLLLLALL